MILIWSFLPSYGIPLATASAWVNVIPKEQAWQEVPLTEPDILCGRYLIDQLTSAYPFKQIATQPNIPQPTNLIEQLAGGRAIVVGHDWGGVVAWWVANRRERPLHSARGGLLRFSQDQALRPA